MSLMECLCTFINGCPYLNSKQVTVDYLGEELDSYALKMVSAPVIVKQYADGGAIKQYIFHFCMRKAYGEDAETNSNNSALLENITSWFTQQTDAGLLPSWDKGKIQEIETISSGELLESTTEGAVYQMQCQIIYYED